MLTRHRSAMRCAVLLGALTGSACVDAPTEKAMRVPPANQQAVKFWDALASTRWNQRATDLLQSLPIITGSNGLPANTPSNGQAWASRTLTYLSLAQYRAVLAATAPSVRKTHPSVSAAVTRASFEVLDTLFKLAPTVPVAVTQQNSARLRQWLADDGTTPGWPGESNQDVAAGDAIGVAVARAVVEQSTNDKYLSLPALTPPVGPSYWFATGPIVRSLWGTTPFFFEQQELVQPPDPPTFGSAEFTAGLDEVKAIVSSRTQEQLDIANKWNKLPPNGPFTAGEWNRAADELIVAHHRTEAEATRILAYANAAAFDAQIACFTTKFRWWVRRPAQADNTNTITPLLAFTTPNHPSYPSGHSCISSAFGAVLADAFPSERAGLDAMVLEAGMSRIYAGIHYRFDIEAGRGVGLRAAAKALAGSLK